MRAIVLALLTLTALAAAPCASAHVRWRVDIGVPVYGYWGPGYWGPAWGPYPPPMVVQQPPVVIVQPAAPPGPAPTAYWYYCANPAGYYPQVPACPAGWTPVPAQPTSPPPAPPR